MQRQAEKHNKFPPKKTRGWKGNSDVEILQ